MYQIVILDAIGNKAAVLRSTLEARLRDLHLDPSRNVEFLSDSELQRLRPDCGKAGVLFSDGAAGQAFAPQVQTLLDSPAVVIPAVTSLDNFALKVPASLRATNGLELDPADTNLEEVAGLVLELLDRKSVV